MGKDQFGSSDKSRRISPGSIRRAQGGGHKPPKKKCCVSNMKAAIESVKRGKYRLARRYARNSVRLVILKATGAI